MPDDLKLQYGRVLLERETLKKRVAKLEQLLAAATIDAAVSEAFRAAGVTKTKLLKPHLAARLKVDPASLEEGRPRVCVTDAAHGHETRMSVTDLVDEFCRSEEFAPVLGSTKGKDGGNEGGGAPLIPDNPFLKGSKSWNVTTQALLRKNNPQLAGRLEAEAKVRSTR